MKPPTLVRIAAGTAFVGLTVWQGSVAFSSTVEPVRTPSPGVECPGIPAEAPPIVHCPISSTPGAPPPVEATTAGSAMPPPVVEPAPPHPDIAVEHPVVSGWVIQAPQIGTAESIVAAPRAGCGA